MHRKDERPTIELTPEQRRQLEEGLWKDAQLLERATKPLEERIAPAVNAFLWVD